LDERVLTKESIKAEQMGLLGYCTGNRRRKRKGISREIYKV
jgi:hypothetical protein